MPGALVLYADSSTEWNEAFLLEAMKRMPPGFAEENARFRRRQDRRNRVLARLLVLYGLRLLGVLPEDGLASWSADPLGRPFLSMLANSPERSPDEEPTQRKVLPANLDFNLSHTDGVAVAVFSVISTRSEHGGGVPARVGVDVERCDEGGTVDEYLGAFTERERSWILGSSPLPSGRIDAATANGTQHAVVCERLLRGEGAAHRLRFLWTRKEAILKAAGTGLSFAPSEIDVLEGNALVGNVRYHSRELHIDTRDNFFCHIASDTDTTAEAIILRRLVAEEILGEFEDDRMQWPSQGWRYTP